MFNQSRIVSGKEGNDHGRKTPYTKTHGRYC